MRERIDPGPDLLDLAMRQAEVITAAQAAEHGLGRHSIARLLDRRQWRRLDAGVFTITPGQPSWESLAWAGVLIGGESARLGGPAAGYLHGLTDRPPPTVLTLTPLGRSRTDRGPWRFRRERPGVRDPGVRGSPPRITVEDCVLDLSDAGARAGGGGTATHWVTAALQQRLTTTARLRAALDRRRLIAGRQLLEDLLHDSADGAMSPLELRYLRRVERAHRLPRGRRQDRRPVGVLESGSAVVRDVYYQEYALVVELDGRVGHVGAGRLRDLRRDNQSVLRGEQTLRYGWFDVVDDACLTAAQVASVLRGRGWRETPVRCPNCRPDLSIVDVPAAAG